MKTANQVLAAIVAGAALNVGLATANLHPVGNLPQVDLTEIALSSVVDTAGMTGMPHIYLGANMASGFAEGFYAE